MWKRHEWDVLCMIHSRCLCFKLKEVLHPVTYCFEIIESSVRLFIQLALEWLADRQNKGFLESWSDGWIGCKESRGTQQRSKNHPGTDTDALCSQTVYCIAEGYHSGAITMERSFIRKYTSLTWFRNATSFKICHALTRICMIL
jgi:hypothetical protein